MPPLLGHLSLELLSLFGIRISTFFSLIRHSDHDRIAVSHHSLHGSGHCCRGRSGRCNLSDRSGAHWRDPQLRRFAGLFSGIGQFVCQAGRNSGGHTWSARLFHGVHFRHIRSVRLLVGAEIPCSNDWRDVSDDALAAVCAGVSAACLLPILSILSGNHISHRRAADRRTALTTPIWRMSHTFV
jgi:hypothetical protein